ncbi:MAG: macrocin O-methyltransferase [Bacteroidetes bacterium]|jgi:O-methyltransferase|nr:macrocin O-methyltransferase [Bacteroidota bacterium]
MIGQSKYLNLLKKILIDFESIGLYEYHPLDIVNPNWKTFFMFPIDRLLRKRNFAICKLKFVDREKRLNGMDWPARAKTMIGMKRLNNIEYCLKIIEQEKIKGDIIETGVWRGGAAIFMKAVVNQLKLSDKTVWLADSFQGVPKPNPKEYSADEGNVLHQLKILKVSQREVRNNFKKFDLLDSNVRFLNGWFSSTLPAAPIQKLCLIRLDGDLYESTYLALQHLYAKLSTGGFIIIDDYNAFPYCKEAVHDFRIENGITDQLVTIDQEAVFWRKTK